MFSVKETSTVAVDVTPTVPTPTTWNPLSFLLLKYGFVKLVSLNNSKSNIFVFFPDITCVKDVCETPNPTLYPRVNDNGGLISAIVCPYPVYVNDIASGINLLDLKAVSHNLNEFLSIRAIKYVKLLKSGLAGFPDL